MNNTTQHYLSQRKADRLYSASVNGYLADVYRKASSLAHASVSPDTTRFTNSLLEGQDIPTLLSALADSPVLGKKIVGVPCPHCGSENYLWVSQQLDSSQEGPNTIYTVEVRCGNCGKSSSLELTCDRKALGEGKNALFGVRPFGARELPPGSRCAISERLAIPVRQLPDGSREFIPLPSLAETVENPFSAKDAKAPGRVLVQKGKGVDECVYPSPSLVYKVLSLRYEDARLIALGSDRGSGTRAGTVFRVPKESLGLVCSALSRKDQ